MRARRFRRVRARLATPSLTLSFGLVAVLLSEVASLGAPPVAAASPVSVAAAPGSPSLLSTALQPVALEGPNESEPALAELPSSDAPLPSEVSVLVGLAFGHAAQLAGLLTNLSNSTSPEFHRYLTAAQFDEAYGPAPSEYDAAVSYFASFGVGGLTRYADRAEIGFTATPLQVERIFHTRLRSVAVGGSPYFVPSSAPELPAPLAATVSGVVGLDSRPAATLAPLSSGATFAPAPVPATAALPGPAATPASTPCRSRGGPFNCTSVGKLAYPEPITPFQQLVFGSDLQVAYNETNASGKGLLQTAGYPTGASVATILWTLPVNTSAFLGSYCASLTPGSYAWDFYAPDVASYLNYTIPHGEPKPTVYSVALSGTSPYAGGTQGRSASCLFGSFTNVENTLDVDMLGSMAPGANVYQVFGQTSTSTDTALADILNPSTSDGPGFSAKVVAGLSNVSVISNSWTALRSGVDRLWDQEAEEAQARGISILASTGDSGTHNLSDPASAAFDSYGTTAVGGTTLILDPSTLLRSPYTNGTNPYTYCPAISTVVCGGETAWQGSTGGVFTGVSEPSWQKQSPDAAAVIATVGIGRGEPDLGAIANQTVLTLTENVSTFNITALANLSTAGGRIVPYWSVTGTSIACPVEAGVVASVDADLYAHHHPWVGFLDPALYTWGQAELNGKLKTPPFFDVIYGSNRNYSARPGFDLVTGWGALDATNFASLAGKLTAVWSNVSTATGPLPAYGASSAYDAKDGYLLQFGGVKANGTAYGTTWAYAGGSWSALATSGHPPARWGASMAYDARDGYVVLFGGLGNASASNPIYGARNDTWIYAGGTWTRLATTVSPPARVWAGMVYDPRLGALVLFGGCPTDLCAPSYSTWMNDTWEFSGGAWTQIHPAVSPSGREVAGQLTYDSATGTVLLFGGYGYLGHTTAHLGYLQDTWTFAKGSWKNVSSGVTPPGRSGGELAYDPAEGYALLFGGQVSSSGFLGTSWRYEGGAWSNVTASEGPGPRAFSSLAYDPATRSLLLWGGINWVSGYVYRYLDDTWSYR